MFIFCPFKDTDGLKNSLMSEVYVVRQVILTGLNEEGEDPECLLMRDYNVWRLGSKVELADDQGAKIGSLGLKWRTGSWK